MRDAMRDAMRLAVAVLLSLALGAQEGQPDAGRFQLGPGDLISFSVYGHQDLTLEVRIPRDGSVTFPLIGTVKDVAGTTIEQLQRKLKALYEDGFLIEANVTVTVKEIEPRRAYIMGAVSEPGYVELSPYTPLTSMQAIGQVGGFSPDANRALAKVVRDDPAKPGTKLAIPIPAVDQADDLREDVILRSGDLVLVPRLDRVYVVGAITRPGAQNLPSGEPLTVSKVIALAGGFDKFARQSDVQLLRGSGGTLTVDVRAILVGEAGIKDPVLEPGDTVSVPESRF